LLDTLSAASSPKPMNALAMASDAAPPRLQRARGEGRIAVRAGDGRTRLDRLFQDGCGKIRLPRGADSKALEAVLINTSGGLTGGDRLAWRAEAGPAAALTLTTQACERVYRASSGVADVRVQLAAQAGAELRWLPQETILFDGGALERSLDVDLAEDARFLAVEAVLLGRQAMGESVRRGTLRDRWRIRRGSRLVFADDLRLSGAVPELIARGPALAGTVAFASILYVAEDAEAALPRVRAALGSAGGASAFEGKLFARVVAASGLELRRALIPALEAVSGGPLPRLWRS